MRTVLIPKEFSQKKYSTDWFTNFIKTNKSSFIFLIKNLVIPEQSTNLKLVLYIIYQISITNEICPTSIHPQPANGLQLKNPKTNEPYGIYHAHLNDGFILIWYLIYNEKGFQIKFEYLQHPPANDNYRTLIKNIYGRNDDGFNLDMGDYLINLETLLLYENLNYIKSFKNFK